MKNIELKKNDLEEVLSLIPKKTGVYIFKDSEQNVIYIGKAKNLYNRVRSYFRNKESLIISNSKAHYLSEKVAGIDYIITDNEVEALVLELNLIKKYRPKFNSSLKDDKSYPYIAITELEKFPRMIVTRNKNIKGAKYFGPYTNVHALREIIEFLRRIFKLRDCKGLKPGKTGQKPCLNYHLELCSGPCAGYISEEDYKRNIEYVMLILKGKDKKILSDLNKQMLTFAKNLEYEKATEIRNKIELIKELYSEQKIYISNEDYWDFISISKSDDFVAASIFMYRQGEFAGFSNFLITNFEGFDDNEILSDFIIRYYEDISNVPSIIYTPIELCDSDMLKEYFLRSKGKKVQLKVPKYGENRKIMGMVINNCNLFLEKKKFEKQSNYNKVFKDIMDLKEKMHLKNIPRRIECYDISNIKNSFPVGSMVVFIDGMPARNNYRHFKVKNVAGQDDFAMLREILERRLEYLSKSNINFEESFYQKPDLIIVDGGKGQFNIAKKVLLEKFFDGKIDLMSIAKKEETLFGEFYPNGINFPKDINFMRLIIKIRDEAHRFAIQYHKKLRDKNMLSSFLDNIKGIGEKKKSLIYEKYNSLDDLKNLNVDEFLKINGLNYKDAKNIYDALHK